MAKKGKLQTWSEYAGLRCVFAIFRVLPRSAALALGKGLAQIVFRVLSGQLKTGMRNLELAFPEMNKGEREMVLRRSVDSLGRTIVEFSKFQPTSAEDSKSLIRFDFEAVEFEAYKAAKAAGRGVLMPTAHIGNWEVLLSGFALQYEPIFFTARELDNPLIDKMFSDVRAKYGNRQFYKSDSAKEVLKALRAGKSVGVLPDVNTDLKEGVFVPFFRVPACTTSGVARLAISTNSLIFPMFGIWDETESKYVVYNGKPIEPARSGDRDADVLETTAAFTAEIEKIVRRFPEQWLWIHKRWKTRPAGEASLY